MRPRFAWGCAVTDGWRPVSTRNGPAEGCVTRNDGQGIVHQLERGVPSPSIRIDAVRLPALSRKAGGTSNHPVSSGSTATVAPAAPPDSGPVNSRGCAFTFIAGGG